MEMITELDDQNFSRKVFQQMTTEWATRRAKEYRAWLTEQTPGPMAYEAALSLMRTPTTNLGVQQEIKNGELVLSKAGDRNRSEVVTEIIEASRQIPRELAAWAIPKMEGEDRDVAIEKAVKGTRWASSSVMGYPPPRIALNWAKHHSDPARRESLIEESYRRWFNYDRDNKGAAGFPENNDWPEELNAVLRKVKEDQK